MKKIIVAFSAVCCLCISGFGQDSSSLFSVGILAGPYFNTGARNFIYPVGYYYRGTDKTTNLSYGVEFSWFKPLTDKIKHGVSARFIYNVDERSHNYKGPSNYSTWTSITAAQEESQASQRSYMASIGYRIHQKVTHKLNLIFGADITYAGHEKRFDNSKLTNTNIETGQFINSTDGKSVGPAGYSAGLGLNAGIEYSLFKRFAVGGQVMAGAFYSHFFGKGYSRYLYKYAGSQDSFSENIFHVNANGYNLSPLNYSISARYYF